MPGDVRRFNFSCVTQVNCVSPSPTYTIAVYCQQQANVQPGHKRELLLERIHHTFGPRMYTAGEHSSGLFSIHSSCTSLCMHECMRRERLRPWKSLISQAGGAAYTFSISRTRVKSRQFIVHIDMPFCRYVRVSNLQFPSRLMCYSYASLFAVRAELLYLLRTHPLSLSHHHQHKVRSIRALKKKRQRARFALKTL